MKIIISVLFILFMSVVVNAKPIQAEDRGLNDYQRQEQKGNKDECLLLALNCGNDFMTLDQKIDRLQKEISKGKAVYTDDELRILHEQLDNANRTREYFKYEGAGIWHRH